jgi:hypothetical protein
VEHGPLGRRQTCVAISPERGKVVAHRGKDR